jgi:copper chaperone
MESIVIKVGGMSCGGCVNSVTGLLEALPGVARASVSLEQGAAQVEYDPTRVQREQMLAAIEDAGFEAS